MDLVPFQKFNQIGQHYVGASMELHERCFSWCRTQNCLFVDSPVGTGFSFQTDASGRQVPPNEVKYTATSEEAAAQMLDVVTQFLRIWPEYSDAPYYLQGLSYAGHYVPWMAHAVLAHNRQGGTPRLNLRGLSVGDPTIDATYQYPTVAPTLEAFGLLTEAEAATVGAIMRNASALNSVDCVASFTEWNRVFNDDGGSSCAPSCDFLFAAFTGSSNTENALLGAAPATMGYFRPWMRTHAPHLHAAGTPASLPNGSSLEEGGRVYAAMVASADFCASTARLYAELFLSPTAPIDVQIYAGNVDPLLGAPQSAAGVRAILDMAEAHVAGGADAKARFYAARKDVWRIRREDEQPAGYARCVEGTRAQRFCHVIVRNSGHEAPSYQPRAAFDLSDRFIRRASFAQPTPVERLPRCAPCGGAPPFAGPALPACASNEGAAR